MKSSESVKLTKDESYYHYRLSFLLVVLSLICIGFWIHGNYFEKSYNDRTEDFLYFSIGTVFLSILFFYLSKQKLYFTEYKTNISEDDLKIAIAATSKELGLQTLKLEKNYFLEEVA
ncbi:MAG: hypothetical protein ACI9XO_004231 [Paraglaciecola sp.]|jgi:hypothetical protein